MPAAAGQVTVRGVSPEAAITDDGVVPTAEMDSDLVPYDAAMTDAATASRLMPTDGFDRSPRYVRLCSGGSPADVDMVGA